MAKKSHGGKRKGSGRKPVDDPKLTLSIYPLTSYVEAVGGQDEAKTIAVNAIERQAKKMKKT